MFSITAPRRLAAIAVALAFTVCAAGVACAPQVAHASGTHGMHRLYNPNSGEHFYTASAPEKENLVSAGWRYEGIGWTAPEGSSTPVYRLYNPNAGDHHYTTSVAERDHLTSVGWNDEGVGWYSDDARGVALYRQYNPNAVAGSHNYTTSTAENDFLVSSGWRAEGVGWYGVAQGGGSGQSSPAACDHEWVEKTETVTVVDEPAWEEEVAYSINHCNVCGENISELDYMTVEEIKERNDWIQSDEAKAMSQRDMLQYVPAHWAGKQKWYDAVSEHSRRCGGNTSIWTRYTYLEHPAVTHTETKTVYTCAKCGATK